ncbi:M20/M25/M40 family metallo-hydrolase [Companilactobacillus crustorum]|uniref:M20/M25/M40 family metallo-hydrolase n=1 Tax=Companilactobacillus crustorum TaxID=392416 RepID=UPI00237EB86F|nr:M20/M25/M40 family metallo-hydrolase [Companilactobacillus crustorum]WDT66650.1 M20/M25/M40 family metallo-hydrolase [Companilactobacillus crustorum]
MDKAQRLSVLDDLIKLETVNGDEEKVANYLKDLFEKNGIETELNKYADNRYNLIASIKKGDGPILGFTGHEDVVPTVNDEKWNYGPFNPKHIDGKIFGRGSSDMKSGLAGLAIALIELNEDPDFKGNIKFLATVGEEVGEIGSQKLSEDGYADDLKDLIVGEPSNSSSRLVMEKLINSGLIETNGATPESRIAAFCAHKGSVTYKVVSHGRAAHSSMPEVGINALDNLISYYNKQSEYFAELVKTEDDVLGTTKPSVTIMNAGKQENTIPGYAEMTVKIRTIPEHDNDKIIAELKDLIDKMNQADPRMKLEFQLLSSNWPVKTDINSDFIKLVKESYKDVLGVNILTVGAPGGTDASKFVQAKPDLDVVVAGPGNESAHQINEFVFEDDYLQYINIYETIARHFFESK